jgi:outer membrane protein OmpA-like peptidoglycan-associated protein
MNISGQRRGLFAGPVFIAAAIIMTGAGTAQAACPDQVIGNFEKAVAGRQVDGAVNALSAFGANPVCIGKLAEYRAKLVDFLIDYAHTANLPEAERDNAIGKAEKIVEVSSYWQGKAKLGDYYFAHRDKAQAHAWYKLSVETLATPGTAGPPPTDKDRKDLMTKLAAAQSLANDDKGGTQRKIFAGSRGADGSLGGIFSRALLKRTTPPSRPGGGIRAAEAVPVPIPINFVTDQAALTQLGQQAMQEMIDAAKQASTTIKLVGHADPRGSHDHNWWLSKARVEAVRNILVQNGVTANIEIAWKGDQEPFDTSALPDADQLSSDDKYQLDRRVVWIRDSE